MPGRRNGITVIVNSVIHLRRFIFGDGSRDFYLAGNDLSFVNHLAGDGRKCYGGRQTADYVDLVLERYALYRQVIE